MARVLVSLLAVLLLSGCFGGPGQIGKGPVVGPPGPSDDPVEDSFYTGEPTPVVLEIHRHNQAFRPLSFSVMQGGNEERDLQAVIRIQRYSGSYVDFERFYTIAVPKNELQVSMPFTLPANPNYRVTVTFYDPTRISDEGFYYLTELSQEKTFNVLANHTNEVTVYTHDLEYTVIAPSELYSGGDLRQIWIEVPPEYNIRDIVSFYGLKPWQANGAGAFWKANAGHVGMGIPHTGWMNHGSAPRVEEPTRLYYQFRLCKPLHLESGIKQICAYIPDVEAGEPLAEITIYPEPDDFQSVF